MLKRLLSDFLSYNPDDFKLDASVEKVDIAAKRLLGNEPNARSAADYDTIHHVKSYYRGFVGRSLVVACTPMARDKLKRLFTTIPAGEPFSSRRLATLGISADLAVSYVRSGWLLRLARGVFCRAGDEPDLGRSLVFLRESLAGLHVGGRTALQWHGLLPAGPTEPTKSAGLAGLAESAEPSQPTAQELTLYGWGNGELPPWFTTRFPATYQRKRLIREEPAWPVQVGPVPGRMALATVSSPERALLELLSEVGVGVALDEARRAAALAGALQGEALQALLQRCTSVKTVRLCVTAGQEFAHPWYATLVLASLPRGSSRPWVRRSADGLLVLPPI